MYTVMYYCKIKLKGEIDDNCTEKCIRVEDDSSSLTVLVAAQANTSVTGVLQIVWCAGLLSIRHMSV